MRTPPNSSIPHHSVEDREQLPHARHQRHLLGLACREQPLVELLDDGVVAGGDEGAHVQGWSSPASTDTFTLRDLSASILPSSKSAGLL